MGKDQSSIIKTVKNYLKDLDNDFNKKPLIKNKKDIKSAQPLYKNAIQGATVDCGIFVCIMIKHCVKDENMTLINQKDMDAYREMIFYEILSNTLLTEIRGSTEVVADFNTSFKNEFLLSKIRLDEKLTKGSLDLFLKENDIFIDQKQEETITENDIFIDQKQEEMFKETITDNDFNSYFKDTENVLNENTILNNEENDGLVPFSTNYNEVVHVVSEWFEDRVTYPEPYNITKLSKSLLTNTGITEANLYTLSHINSVFYLMLAVKRQFEISK